MKKAAKQHFWAGKEDKQQSAEWKEAAATEFSQPANIADDLANEFGLKGNRRDFLKMMGFGLGAAVVAAGCDTPVRRAIPYVVKPDDIVPGVANYYATSYVDGGDFVSVLVKTREGRPIKIEGNPSCPITGGGTHARSQASVLSLYNTHRFQQPLKRSEEGLQPTSWQDLDREVVSKLRAANNIRIVSHTVLSPTAMQVIAEFKQAFSNVEHVMYDPISSSAALIANEQQFGVRALPNYRFDKADTIISFGADFLGTWLSPVEFAKQYTHKRKLTTVDNPSMSWHVQFESAMTLTGSNADNRVLVRPSEMGAAIVALHNAIAGKMGGNSVASLPLNEEAKAAVNHIADTLASQNGRSLIVAATNNIEEQRLVNSMNQMLGNYGRTLDMNTPYLVRKGDDRSIRNLVRDLNSGSVDALIVWDANPAYDIPDAAAFASGMEKVDTCISLATRMDETTDYCDYIAPRNHFLESWGDAEPKRGTVYMIQPVIAPLYDTRQAEASLLTWGGSANYNANEEQPYYAYLQSQWKSNQFTSQSKFGTFDAFWNQSLHDGFAKVKTTTTEYSPSEGGSSRAGVSRPSNAEFEMAFIETVNMGSGQHADNPWLQEMPDPVTRCVWGNYLMLPVAYDAATNDYVSPKGLRTFMDKADRAEVTIGDVSKTVTVAPTFGTMPQTLGLALGYGRSVSSPAGQDVGIDVYPWLGIDADGQTQYYATDVALSERAGEDKEYACVQYHHTYGVKGEVDGEILNVDEREVIDFLTTGYQGGITDRTILYTGSRDELPELTETIAHMREHAEELNSETLYPDYSDIFGQGHHWGLYIDMNACYGCGACTVACMAENNVPVVGKREVHRHHEMTWLRIDRYFYGDVNNPHVAYQPVMCQHCDNAPCENVCPVNATNHSSEGLNQMAYNRCIGTRYCANNCPFKVRRFNWLDYTTADLFGINENHPLDMDEAYYTDNIVRMVFNPDVTVRSRGVIEKCSFCVQRIQEGKLAAKVEGRKLKDGEIKTACQSACNAGAIIFGDQNDSNSYLERQKKSPLTYQLLEETNMRTSVFYGARVNNRDKRLADKAIEG